MRFSRPANAVRILDGGIDTENVQIDVRPEMFVAGHNHCLADPKGYERIPGYERTDGRFLPSEVGYTWITGVITSNPDVGDTVTNGTATGQVLLVDNGILVFMVDGVFNNHDNLTVDAVTVITDITPQENTGAPDVDTDLAWRSLASNAARATVQAVPGAGKLTGAIKHKGILYSFRDDGAENKVYRSTATGWQRLDLGKTVRFSGGGAGKPVVGDTLTTGAVITGIQKESGAWSGSSAVGILTYQGTDISGGDTISFVHDGGTIATATASGDSEVVTRKAGGKLQVQIYNFKGDADTLAAWVVDGVNLPFKLDGNLVEIHTGIDDKFPNFLVPHRHHLFLSYGSHWLISGIGDPFKAWTALYGADEWGMGDVITGAIVTPNGTLLSFCKNKIDVVYGSTVGGADPFTIKPYSIEHGAIKDSIQNSIAPTFVNDSGLTIMTTTQKWGDFEINNIDERVKTLVDALFGNITCSVVFQQRAEYRVYAGVNCVRMKTNNGKIRGFTSDVYDIPINNIWSNPVSTRDEVFFVSDSGYVYKMDSGPSFDGGPVSALMVMAPDHIGSSRRKKKWYDTTIELESKGITKVFITNEYSLFDPDRIAREDIKITADIQPGIWDVSKWDECIFGDDAADFYYTYDDHATSCGVQTIFFSENTDEAPYLVRLINRRYAWRGEKRT